MAAIERFLARSVRELIDRDQLGRLLKPASDNEESFPSIRLGEKEGKD